MNRQVTIIITWNKKVVPARPEDGDTVSEEIEAQLEILEEVRQ